jgi:hypothetical protein
MKKILSLLLIFILTFLCNGCNQKEELSENKDVKYTIATYKPSREHLQDFDNCGIIFDVWYMPFKEKLEKTITTDELPYDYETIHYGEDTKPGVYVDTIKVEKDGKEYVIIHTLTIEQGTAVDVVKDFDLIMVPNPLKANSILFINAEFSDEERNGLVVEVFNAVGQCIYMETPTVYPIAVDGLNTTGVYVVRVITGNGKSYLDKVIVE